MAALVCAEHPKHQLMLSRCHHLSSAQENGQSCTDHLPCTNVPTSKHASLIMTYCGAYVQACDRYKAAWNLKQSSSSALYNWGVALSDMSRVLKTTDRATANGLLTEAAEKYATSLQWSANNPQVCNARRHAKISCAMPGTNMLVLFLDAIRCRGCIANTLSIADPPSIASTHPTAR